MAEIQGYTDSGIIILIIQQIGRNNSKAPTTFYGRTWISSKIRKLENAPQSQTGNNGFMELTLLPQPEKFESGT